LTVVFLLIIHVPFLHVWLAHIVYMLGVIEESQENTETMRCHKAHNRRFWLLTEATLMRRTHQYFGIVCMC